MSAHVQALDERSFDAALAAGGGGAVVVDFWAPWCGPCRMMAPALESAAAQLAGRVSFAKVNTDESPALAARFAIRSIPTLILFRDGREVRRMSGVLDARSLVAWVQQAQGVVSA
ncbi:MAG TPA: thioredoxin [Burkholderiales bacterium]|nr:thioredoxin [Burkholderiales bacterium]